MSVTYNNSASVNSNGAGKVSGSWQDIGNNDLQISQGVPAGINTPLGITFNGANLQNLFLVATQNMTIYINAPSTGSPFATFNLKAGIPFRWSEAAGYFANPLNVSVTNIYATSTTAALLSGRVLTN